MNIILTGEKRAGKTTACLTLAGLLRERGLSVGGVICQGGMIHDLMDGSHTPFYAPEASPDTVSVGEYHIFHSALSFGCGAIEGACAAAQVIFIDEFGRLEMNGEGLYRDAVKALDTERALVVVRKSLLEPFKRRFSRYDYTIVKINHKNRSRIPGDILSHLDRWKI